MKKGIVIVMILAGAIIIACNNNQSKSGKTATIDTTQLTPLQVQARTIFGTLPNLVKDSLNPITPEKVALGQALYYDPILSKNKTQSCNTCHNLSTFGVDNSSFSTGDAGKLGGRNAPTTLNAALKIAQFWDGRAKTVEDQAGGPILNPLEMALPSKEEAVNRLKASPAYVDMFKKTFPNDADPVTWDNLLKAIGAFERELVTPSRFDQYLAGDDNALSPREKQGLQDFLSMGCISCHNGVAIGGGTFQKFGVFENYRNETKSTKEDSGLASLNNNIDQRDVFQVPSLRNVTKTYPYFHDGSVRDLREAVRIMGKIQLNKQLTPEQTESITTFFDSLVGNVDTTFMKDTHPVAVK